MGGIHYWMTGLLDRQNRSTTRLFEAATATLGLGTFIYSVSKTIQDSVTNSVDWDWIVLSLITVLLISRAEIKLVKTSSAMTLADTIILATVLLYGTSAAVALAGIDNLIRCFQKKNKNRESIFHAAAMCLSFFIAGQSLMALQGRIKVEQMSWEQLALATGILAVIHLLIYSGLGTFFIALRL